MTNLFEAIKNVSDEALREQLALFEVFTVPNVYKEVGHKVTKQLVKATNVVTGLMKKDPLEEPEGFSIDEALKQKKLRWQEEPRDALEEAFKKMLVERCGGKGHESEEVLSVGIIDEAAELYDLKEELLPTQKAEWIAKYYKEDRSNGSEEKSEVKTTEAFIKLKMPLGKTKMLRYLFVQLITLAVEVCDEQMTIKDTCLPSWRDTLERETLKKDEQKLIHQLEKDTQAYDLMLQKLLDNKQLVASKNKMLEEEEKKQEVIKACISKLKQKIEDEALEKEIHMKKRHISSYEGMLQMSQEEIESAKYYLKRWKEEGEVLAKKVEKALHQKEVTVKHIEEKKDEAHKQREMKWEAFYSDFKFETDCLQIIRETMDFEAMLDCERTLMALHEMTDRTAMSWGEAEGDIYKCLFCFNDNGIGSLKYQITEGKDHTIHILEITKLDTQ